MDDLRFDGLARRLKRVGDRRDLLRAAPVVGAVIFGLAAVPGGAESKKQRKKRRKKRCGNGKIRCGNACVRGTCCPGQPCGSDGSCTCSITAEGNVACLENIGICTTCTDKSGCDPNEECVPGGGCIGACFAVCSA